MKGPLVQPYSQHMLSTHGLEEVLNALFLKDGMKHKLLEHYQKVRDNVGATIDSLPEQYREASRELADKMWETFSEEFFIQSIRNRFMNEVGLSLYTLGKYYNVAGVVQELSCSVGAIEQFLNGDMADPPIMYLKLNQMAIWLAVWFKNELKFDIGYLHAKSIEDDDESKGIWRILLDEDCDQRLIHINMRAANREVAAEEVLEYFERNDFEKCVNNMDE